MTMADPRLLLYDGNSTTSPPPEGTPQHRIIIVWSGSNEWPRPPIRLDSLDEMALSKYDLDAMKKEPKRREFSDPWQKRPSRTKNRSPYRVAKRRRRTQIAKQTRKLMKLAEQRREAERAKLAAKK